MKNINIEYYYDRQDNKYYKILKSKCPICNSKIYIHDGGDQGGIPHIQCSNDNCHYISY